MNWTDIEEIELKTSIERKLFPQGIDNLPVSERYHARAEVEEKFNEKIQSKRTQDEIRDKMKKVFKNGVVGGDLI